MNILVTAVGGDLGQSVIKCLKNSKYQPFLVGCDSNPYAGGQKDVDVFYPVPHADRTGEYEELLQNIIQSHNVQYVFPLSHEEIQFFQKERSRSQEKSPHIVMQSPGLVDTFFDKYKTALYFKAKHFPFPQTWIPEDYDNQLEFPLVLKSRSGRGGQDFCVVQDTEELKFYISRRKNLVIQEYLSGGDNEYTAGLFSDGRSKWTITFRRTLAPGGFSQEVELVQDKQVLSFSRKLAEILDFKGSLNAQFRQTEDGFFPFEINPRFSSTVYFRHLFGFKDVEWSLDLCEGKPILYSGPSRRGVGVRTSGEILLQAKGAKTSR